LSNFFWGLKKAMAQQCFQNQIPSECSGMIEKAMAEDRKLQWRSDFELSLRLGLKNFNCSP